MPNPLNVPITPPRVAFIDPRTGTVSREWYMFFLSLFQLSGGSSVSLDDVQKGPPMLTVDEINAAVAKASENLRPSTESVVEQIAELRKQIDALEAQVRPELGTMSQLQQAWLPWVTWDTAPEVTPPTVGTLAWDGGTTLGIQMTPNVIGRVNESGYYYIKASSAITKGQVVMFTGAVGASGVPTGAPATGVTDGSYIMGVAAETIAHNDFGLVQFIGSLRGVDLSAYSDGDILWYNPAVVGGLTNTKPNAPNVAVQMAAVISNSNNGTMLVRVTVDQVTNTWMDLVGRPSAFAGTSTVSGVPGDVRVHTKTGLPDVYRFIPSNSDPTLDAFYAGFAASVLSGFIVSRG